MPVNTLRAWFFGVIWAILLSGINQFLFFRYPSILLGSVSWRMICLKSIWWYVFQIVAQLTTFPLGRLWAKFMPQWKVFGVPLNPGPFTIKEHVSSVFYHASFPSHSMPRCWWQSWRASALNQRMRWVESIQWLNIPWLTCTLRWISLQYKKFGIISILTSRVCTEFLIADSSGSWVVLQTNGCWLCRLR